VSVSEGENWKREEREEVDEAAALRRSCGRGEAERKVEGRDAFKEEVEVIFVSILEASYRAWQGEFMVWVLGVSKRWVQNT